MREQAHAFGEGGALVGIVTKPAPEAARPGAPAILLANVGMHHRVGPYRLFVDLARRLAELGFTTLRFDLSGLGDSGTRPSEAGTDEERWVADMTSAMALLEQKHGIGSFVVLGLCSGVDQAHAVALADPRVRGAVFVDGHAFATRKHQVHRLVVHTTKPRTWELFLKRRLPGAFGIEAEPDFGTALAFQRVPMTRERFVRDLERLLARDIPLLYAFTGEQNHVFSHADQFHDMVHPAPSRGRVDVVIHRRADHTLSIPEDRRAFVTAIGRWMADKFPFDEQARTSVPPPVSHVRLVEVDDASKRRAG